jgi:hypothetical protein
VVGVSDRCGGLSACALDFPALLSFPVPMCHDGFPMESRRPSATQQLLRPDALLLMLASLAGINLFAASFIRQERYVYGWDSALWWWYYQHLGSLLGTHPLRAAFEVIQSARQEDYSMVLVLFLTPFQLLFGSGRVPFVLAAVTMYVFPAAILVALVSYKIRAELVDHGLVRTMMVGLPTFLLLPAVWSPILLGSPDLAGVVVICAILLIYLSRPLVDQPFSTLITIGILCALLILVRRWYAYWVVSFFLAAVVTEISTGRGSYPATVPRRPRSIRNLAVVGTTAVVTFFLAATPLAMRMVSLDYVDMYSTMKTYKGVWPTVAHAAWGFYWYMGPLISLLFLAGVVNGLARRASRDVFVLLLVQFVAIVVLLTRVLDFDLHHYSLLIPFIVIAIAGLVSDLAGHAKARPGGPVIVTIYILVLAGQFALVFIPAVAPYLSAVPFLTRYRQAPLQRGDLAELKQLVSAVAADLEGNDATAYVVASSPLLNDDLLRNACRQFGHPDATCDRIARTSHWDRRDGLPGDLFTARYVVLATPVQYHRPPEHQRVIGIPADAILRGRGIGSAFQALPGEFVLDRGVHVVLYERKRPLEQAELQSIEKQFLDLYPGRVDLFSLRSGSARSR